MRSTDVEGLPYWLLKVLSSRGFGIVAVPSEEQHDQGQVLVVRPGREKGSLDALQVLILAPERVAAPCEQHHRDQQADGASGGRHRGVVLRRSGVDSLGGGALNLASTSTRTALFVALRADASLTSRVSSRSRRQGEVGEGDAKDRRAKGEEGRAEQQWALGGRGLAAGDARLIEGPAVARSQMMSRAPA